MGKSEWVEGLESLHTTGGPTDYLCSATLMLSLYMQLHFGFAVRRGGGVRLKKMVFQIHVKHIVYVCCVCIASLIGRTVKAPNIFKGPEIS